MNIDLLDPAQKCAGILGIHGFSGVGRILGSSVVNPELFFPDPDPAYRLFKSSGSRKKFQIRPKLI